MPVKKKPVFDGKKKRGPDQHKVAFLWRDDYFLKAYLLAKDGLPDTAIRRALGCGPETWRKWLVKHSALVASLQKGRQERSGSASSPGSFKDYIYNRLPSRLRLVWERIVELDAANDEERLEALLSGQGKLARQHLWANAFCYTLFNVTEACRMVGINSGTLRQWKEEDADFAEIVDTVIFQAKKDFCESALMRGVASGDPGLIRFANETLNADRGYNKKSQMQVSGEVVHRLQESVRVDTILAKLSVEDLLKLQAAFQDGTVIDSPNLLPAHVEANEGEDHGV